MNRIKSVMLLTLLSLLLMAIGGVFGGRQGALIMLLVSFVINFISYWNSDKIALASYRAQPISPEQAPELHKLVKQLADNAGIAMPRLYLIPTDVPNAFATGRDDKHAAVAVTEGLLRILNRDEVAGVISHELSHIKHRDTLVMTLAASLASAISYIANIAQWGLIFGHRGDDREGNPLALLLTIIVAPIAATLIQLALSRSREFMADASGAAISGKPLALASALQKLDDYARNRVLPGAKPETEGLFIINPLCGKGGLQNMFSTHPSTEERIEKLREIAANMN